jgi:DNA helicase-2/ATP-dependent DNA helicase PcrA
MLLHEDTLDLEGEIFNFVVSKPPQSFILYAGAGAGKTHTLHQTLKKIKENILFDLVRENKKLAIITYTNAACDEIKERINYDDNFSVNTIHSFAWSLISPFTNDIKNILEIKLVNTILEEEDGLRKAKSQNNKASLDRKNKINRANKRLLSLKTTKSFTYNPNSSNSEETSLEHSEIIDIFSKFLLEKKSFRKILINKYPILFVDEAQDTYEKVIDALIQTQVEFNSQFVIGLFGDNMQRIFQNNSKKIDHNLPENWARPKKIDNWRCPQRVVQLINKIRFDDDQFEQEAKKELQGFVRCLIVDTTTPLSIDKSIIEENICKYMLDCTSDENWKIPSEVKTLILEHHMAATRSNFYNFYKPLYDNKDIRSKLNTADTQALRFLIGVFYNFIIALKYQEGFKIIKILRENSEIFKDLHDLKNNQLDYLKEIKDKKDYLFELIKSSENNTIKNILNYIFNNNLLNIPEVLIEALNFNEGAVTDSANELSEIQAYSNALDSNINELINYVNYIDGRSSFGTHQGVKGLQFERVMAILDDDEASGFLFNYEKFLGIKNLSENDRKNEAQGEDNALSRTRRLFYVICSRAEKSLAVVCYTKSPELLKGKLIEKEWFDESEIHLI